MSEQKPFAIELRDLINAAYARGIHQEEIVYALANAEDPVQIKLTQAALAAKREAGEDVPKDYVPPVATYTPPAPTKNNSVDLGEGFILGSDTQPDSFVLVNDKEIQLGTVVAEAFKQSGLTTEEWNGLNQDQREEKIAALVAEMPLKKA